MARAMRPRTYQEGGWRRFRQLRLTDRTGAGGVLAEELPSYLVLVGHLLVGEVGDGHLAAGQLADLVLGPLAGFARVEEVAQRLVVDLHEARREGELSEEAGESEGFTSDTFL